MQVQATPPPSLKKHVKKALELWHTPNTGKSPLEHLHLFRASLHKTHLNHRAITNDMLFTGIEWLTQKEAECAAYLQERFLDETSIVAIAQKRNMGQTGVYTLQKLAIEWLASVVWDMESEARQAHTLQMLNRLEPSSYHHLVGVKAHQDHLLEKLSLHDSPYILSITGIGGIGKTSLADSIVRRVIAEGLFSEVGWVTARQQKLNLMAQIESVSAYQPNAQTTEAIVRELCQQLMPDLLLPTNFSVQEASNALQKHLYQSPHLIVIDNLETVDDLHALLPLLQQLANPSKFLLTSRENLHSEANLYHYAVPTLNETDSLQLVRQEAVLRSLTHIAQSTDDQLHPIYATVGGNPLALRLVVGLAHYERIDDILLDLTEAHNDTADKLYTYIYRQAWDKLQLPDQQVLLTMLAIQPGGDTLDVIVQFSGLPLRDVRSSLKQLCRLNLVNTHTRKVDDAHEPYYSIHSLTRSFLMEQFSLWKSEK